MRGQAERHPRSALAALVIVLGSTVLAGEITIDLNQDPALVGAYQAFGVAQWRADNGASGAVNDGYLSLTDATNSQQSAIVLKDFNNRQSVSGFSFSMDVRLGGGTDSPADGLSVNFVREGDELLQNGSGFSGGVAEEGSQTGLAIGFDTWNNGGDDVIGISVRVDNQLIAQYSHPTINGDCGDPTSLQTGTQNFAPNLPSWANLCWQPVTLQLATNGILEISYKGHLLENSLQTSFIPGPGQFVVGARTGEANENHHVDNIKITTVLTSQGQPQIIRQPQSQTIYQGESVTLRVSGAGAGPFNYTWRRDGVDIAGGGPVLSSITQAGTYQVAISNSQETILSDPAKIAVLALNSIGGPITSPVNGHLYYLLDQASWQASETAARKLGGHLATIRNADEEGWVFSNFGRYAGTARDLWLGLYDPDQVDNSADFVARRSEFLWVSSEPVTFSNWVPGEPNNMSNSEFFVHIWNPDNGAAGLWNDNDGSQLFNGVVEVVVGANQAPVLGNMEATDLAYLENQAATPVSSSLTVSDTDSATLTGATIQITANYDSAQDLLGFSPTGGISGQFNVGTGTLTLTGTATLANYQAALRNVTYQNTSGIPSLAPRTVTFIANDGAQTNNVSASVTRIIRVAAVNDAPTFVKGSDLTLNEDSPPLTLPGWATGISPGPADEADQHLIFLLSNDNNSLFSVSPAVTADGRLTFTLAPEANGIATVTVRLKDDGGVLNGGKDTSTQLLNIVINSVNDPPVFTKGEDQVLLPGAGAQNKDNWATNIRPGPSDEAGQTVAFAIIGNTNPNLFSQPPFISSTGTLTYTPAPNVFGTSLVTIQLRDNGGTANGGVDVSAPQSFSITVRTNTRPIISGIPDQTIAQNSSTGLILFTVSDAETESSGLTVDAFSSNQALAPDTSIFKGMSGDNRTLNIRPAPNQSGTALITVTVSDGTLAATDQFLLTVLAPSSPPTIRESPTSQTVELNGPVTFRVVADGTSLSYQWRKNGDNIPGATNSTFTIFNANKCDGARYEVVVQNPFGFTKTLPADLQVNVRAEAALSDFFLARPLTTSANGSATNNNAAATAEADEPHHGGKPARHSMWVGWQAPKDGIVTFDTCGSNFDTVLAAYEEAVLPLVNLVPLARDDDHTNYYRSVIQFNAVAGTQYAVAVDGFAGATGNIVLSWAFDETVDRLPVIQKQPASQVVAPGVAALLQVVVQLTDTQPLQFEWYRNSELISRRSDAGSGSLLTNTLIVPTRDLNSLGIYRVKVSTSKRSLWSDEAALEFGGEGATTHSKFQSIAFVPVGGATGPAQLSSPGLHGGAQSVGFGNLGTQTFYNSPSGVQVGEAEECNQVIDSSRWYGLELATSGVLVVDTIGSDLEMVLTVYQVQPLADTNDLQFGDLISVQCDRGTGPDGASLIHWTTSAGRYAIQIDRLKTSREDSSAVSTTTFNWALLPSGTTGLLGLYPNPHNVTERELRLTAAPPVNVAFEESTDLNALAISWQLKQQITGTDWVTPLDVFPPVADPRPGVFWRLRPGPLQASAPESSDEN